MSQMGHSRHFDGTPATSGLLRLTDIPKVNLHVSNAPEPHSCPAVNGALAVTMIYSITSSARARSDSAIISPIGFALFRLAGEQRQTPG